MMQAMRTVQAPRAPPPPSRRISRTETVRSAGKPACLARNPAASRTATVAAAAATSAADAADAAATASAPSAMPADGASRRAALAAMAGSYVSASLIQPGLASAGETNAGSYLPPSDVPGLVTYVPNMQKTPALRAGVIRDPYSVLVPENYVEAKLANIATGNFCMPNCGEPWTEVAFEKRGEGKVSLLVSPLVKLTNKPNVGVEALGSPEELIDRIGPFITGASFERDDDLVAAVSKTVDGRTYYYYELYALSGNGHSLAAVTTRGAGLYLLVANGTEKGWKAMEGTYRAAVDGFRA